jgi:Ca2+-binding EF-hand superfamily protein
MHGTLMTTTALIGLALAAATPAAFAQSSDQQSATAQGGASGAAASFCQQGWSQADQDGDGNVTREEIDALARAEFRQIDADGDGEITQSEFDDCMSRMRQASARTGQSDGGMQTDGSQPSGQQQQSGMQSGQQQQGGTQADGSQQSDQQQQGGTQADGSQQSGQQQQSAGWTARSQEDEQAFAQADRNRDEQLGTQEYGQAVGEAYSGMRRSGQQPSGQQQTGQDPQVLLLRQYVLVPTAEVSDARMREMSEDEIGARAGRAFDDMDRDGDGRITKEEWQQAERGAGQGDQRREPSFQSLDQDGSGGVSEEEYRQSSVQALSEAQQQGTGQTETAARDQGVPVIIYRVYRF